jgi:hypothetical protein
MMVPALIAGGSLGFVSGLPIANCACCLWAAGAGFLAAFLYSRSCRRDGAAFDAGKGGVVGLIAGAVFGVVGGAMNSVITLLTGGLDPEAMREAIDANPMISDPDTASQAMQFFESVGPLFLVLLFVLIWLVAGTLLAALGGLIGGAAFKVTPAPPAAAGGWSSMPPAAPPAEPPPSPPLDPGL